MPGSEIPIIWRGRRARAFVPTPLSHRNLDVGREAAVAAARAQAAVEHGAESLPEDWAPLARLLLRAEGIASSYIEGVSAPIVDVVLAETAATAGTPASWVAANLAAVTQAIESAHTHSLALSQLCDWHSTLMAGSPTPARHVGVLRREQGWIGGTSPLDAHLVTPPPEHVPRLMDDLIEWVNSDTVDPITQAAVAHAQFEIIHPFADGNGRVGRILIAWILVRRLSLLAPPPVSTMIAADVGGYTHGLVLYRIGDIDPWVSWFADAVSGSGESQRGFIEAVREMRVRWNELLSLPRGNARRLRSNSQAWRVLDLIPRHLVLTAPTVARELGIPTKTAVAAIRTLVEAGILTEHGTIQTSRTGRPSAVYVCEELLGLAGATPLR